MFAKVNGVNLFYEKSGSGPPLLLLHGNSEDHRVFDKIVVKLANHFTVYALDSREQGASEKTGQFSYALMAEDVYAFVVDLGLGQVNLAGFSDGAIVGLLLGLSRPQILKKMILMGPNLKPGDLTDEAVAFLRELEAQGDYPLFRVIFKEPDIELSSLKNVKVPCLVVAGENDLFKPETIPAIARALPNATLKIWPGHDHLSYIVDSDLMYEDFLIFFGKSEGERAKGGLV